MQPTAGSSADSAALLALQRRALAEVQRLVDGVPADRLGARTPCVDWDVQTLLGHLVAGNRRMAEAAAGGSLMDALGEIAPAPDAAAYAKSARDVVAAWSEPAAIAQERSSMTLTAHLGECVLHGWDLSRATGQAAQFGDDVLDVVEPFGRAFLSAERPAGGPFAAAVEPPPGASRLDALAAFYGRAV